MKDFFLWALVAVAAFTVAMAIIALNIAVIRYAAGGC